MLFVAFLVFLSAVAAVVAYAVLSTSQGVQLPGPRVYVGSAYKTDLMDMVERPGEWATVRRSCGLFVQPMGLRAIGDSAYRTLAGHFANPVFTIVFNLGGVIENVDPLRDYKIMKRLDPRFRCAGYFLYVKPDYLLGSEYPRMVRLVRQGASPAKALGVPVFIFLTPLSRDDDNPRYGDFLQSGRWWMKLLQDTGCDGISVDFPHIHWLTLDRPPWRVSRWRQVADAMCRDLQAARKTFIWSLNGATGKGNTSLADVDEFVTQLHARGTRPDMWLVDHFDPLSQEQRGTPETAETTTGIAARLLKYVP